MSRAAPAHELGVISDTHGLVRPEALAALRGVEQILHAGDVERPGVLEELGYLAPVTAVRGNVDLESWARVLPPTARLEVGGARILVIHDLDHLALDPAAAGLAVVIFGHSHRAAIEWRDGVLHFNPGSAGPRRFKLPVTVGRLRIWPGRVEARIVELRV